MLQQAVRRDLKLLREVQRQIRKELKALREHGLDAQGRLAEQNLVRRRDVVDLFTKEIKNLGEAYSEIGKAGSRLFYDAYKHRTYEPKKACKIHVDKLYPPITARPVFQRLVAC